MKHVNCALRMTMDRLIVILTIGIFVLIGGCKDQAFDEHYERPSWLKGNAWDLLEGRGNYTIFLKAIEKSGFQSLVQGKGIVTVMAPNDDAFNKYFQAKGIAGLDQLSSSEVRKLVGYHLVYYSFNRDQFANYQPYGKNEQRLNEDGLYYKHRTYSRDTISTRVDPSDGKQKTIFHKERFLPVMSNYLFSTKGIDPTYNYQYFYPGSSGWAGDAEGFNVSNAAVEEYSLPTDNGYIYTIDAVLDPLETIYTELADQPEYSTFLELYDKFIDFWYDVETTNDFAEIGDSLYIIRHIGLPEIASEWSYNGEGGLPDYANLPDLTGEAFNVFAPNNPALSAFFDEYWSEHYASINDVGYLPVAYLLYNHVNQGSVVFPEEITLDKITTPFGNSISFDPDADVIAKKMCVNGTFYGLGSVIVPDMFNSVTGPAFQDPQYRMFLYMLNASGLVGPLMSDALNFTIFMPSDDVVQEVLFENSFIYWNEGNPAILGDEALEVENDNGARVPMSVGSMTRFVNNHIVNDEITSFSTKKVYGTRNSFSYIYVNDSVDTNLTYNKGETINVSEIDGDWTNGSVYTTDKVFIRETTPIKALIGSTQSEFSELNYISKFGELLAAAGLIQADQELNFLLGDDFLLFAPSNAAIEEAEANDEIPDVSDQAALAEYLKYYFVPLSFNSINDFPFEGFGVDGTFKTAQLQDAVSKTLDLDDTGSSLVVTDGAGTSATVISEFPGVYSDGAVYLIDNVLKSE